MSRVHNSEPGKDCDWTMVMERDFEVFVDTGCTQPVQDITTVLENVVDTSKHVGKFRPTDLQNDCWNSI